jgi:serine protease Do
MVANGGEFDKAIESATQRVVKLFGLGAGVQVGYGSGILVSADGRIVTVLSLLVDARRLRVVMPDGTRREADVVHRDSQRHLAWLQLKPAPYAPDPIRAGPQTSAEGEAPTEPRAASNVPAAPLPHFDLSTGRPRPETPDPKETPTDDDLRPGDWIVAAGNAFKVAQGAEPVSIAHGVFSARTRLDARRRVREYPFRGEVLVIDAITSNPGAPGGAVVNLNGRLVGMVGRDVISNLTHTHFNYAIPTETLRDSLAEALDAVNRAPSDNTVPGVDTADTTSWTSVGTGNRGMTAAPVTAPPVDYGLRVARTGYQTILPFVERVRPGSPADRAGLRADDLILSMNGRSVADVEEFDARMKDLIPNEPLDLVVRRDRRILNLRIQLESVDGAKNQ